MLSVLSWAWVEENRNLFYAFISEGLLLLVFEFLVHITCVFWDTIKQSL